MNDDLIHHPPDLATSLLRLAQKCAICTNSQDFADLVRNEVRPVLPHTSLIAAMGRIDLEHLELLHVEAVDYPPAVGDGRWIVGLAFLPQMFFRRALSPWALLVQLAMGTLFRSFGLVHRDGIERWIHLAGLLVTEFLLLGVLVVALTAIHRTILAIRSSGRS